ncbi:MAG TPA: hypothetical protein DEF00_01845 [Candidatus Taylorbacteria bacterium]|nr:MAG: hypothetical protein UY03_C0007G0035 [Parcubacteria group bacterium GW2011_GWA2_47_64]KKU96350.1 MAG: hypothetical protein UY29_C0013G0002 [Parcubacteria group bacterium GW2011_GWC2_48_17]HBV01120.1 hypothetical protein [Candidatus Taylorbacteria bacterium]
MSQEANFAFVTDTVLQRNLDITFEHLIELLSLSESGRYTETLKSSFRKTVIVYTASIVEALLLWTLKQKTSEEALAKRQTIFKVSKVIYEINATERIVLGKDEVKVEKCRFEKLNLDQVNDLCKEHGIISDSMFKDVDRVRVLRNRLHISTLPKVEEDYSKSDLEFVFSVARTVKNLAKA